MAQPDPLPTPDGLHDEQSRADTRAIPINQVGIKDILHPIRFADRGGAPQSTVAKLTMTVNLPPDVKGTHMSRFVHVLDGQKQVLTMNNFSELLREMTRSLGADEGRIEMAFPFFVRKAAPVSGVQSYLDYQVRLAGRWNRGAARLRAAVVIPVTSLCPCSKSISDYGAHNQRSHITVGVSLSRPLWLEELIETVEAQASCELYGLLKRPDEKYVTERAYDNPKFVEDMVRDIAVELNRDDRVRAYRIESENFESIHNHSAYACIEKDKTKEVAARKDNITYLAMSRMQSATMTQDKPGD